MPTETFYNLNSEKKEKIINAMKNEFSRVPLNELSINRIIEDSDISKGSFYQYFKNKDEAIKYILKIFIDEEKEKLIQILKKNKGNIFKFSLEVLELAKENINEQDVKIAKNVIKGISDTGISLIDIKNNMYKGKCNNDFIDNIDISNFCIKSNIELKALLELIIKSLAVALIDIFTDKNKYDEIRQMFQIQLDILERGIIREENKC